MSTVEEKVIEENQDIVTAEAVIQEEKDKEEENTLEKSLENCIKNIETKLKEIKSILNDVKKVKKEFRSIDLKMKKIRDKKLKKAQESPRKLNGFNIPVQISNELITFLKDEMPNVLKSYIEDPEFKKDIPKNTELLIAINQLGHDEESNKISRANVTKSLNCYIKFHKKQDTENRKFVKLDDSVEGQKFLALLSDYTPEMTFFNMQKNLKHHFFSKQLNGFPEKKSVATINQPIHQTAKNNIPNTTNTIKNPTPPKPTETPKNQKTVRRNRRVVRKQAQEA